MNIGLTVDGGPSATLAARLGHARTFGLTMLASASLLSRRSIVNRVVPDAELEVAAGELTAKLAKRPPEFTGN